MTQVIDSEDDVLPLPPPVSLPPSRSNSKDGVPGSQQQPSSRLRKRKVNEQNKGSRKRVKREVKLNLSPREISHLQNGEMLNDTHIDVANQMLRKQFPEVRGLQSPLLGQSLSFAVTEPPFVQESRGHPSLGDGDWSELVTCEGLRQCIQHCRKFFSPADSFDLEDKIRQHCFGG